MAQHECPTQDLFSAEWVAGKSPLDRRFFLTQDMALLSASGLAAISVPPVSAAEPPATRGMLGGANVKDFGAVGDGVTDDTAAIQRAINHVMTAGGGTVFFPAGVYLVSATLTITMPRVTLLGPGELFKKTGTNAFTIQITAPWTVIEGLQINGNQEGQHDQTVARHLKDEIRLEHTASHCQVLRCKIVRSAGSGIAGYGSGHNIIAYNQVYNCYQNGIFFGGPGADYNQILFNDVEKTTEQNGIFITASPGSEGTEDTIHHNQIIGNLVKGAGDTGIESGIHAISSIVALNHAMDSRNAAILIRENLYAQVFGNAVDMANAPEPTEAQREDDPRSGIVFWAQYQEPHLRRYNYHNIFSLCVNNMVSNCPRYGIRIGGHSYVTLAGNTIHYTGDTPIRIEADAEHITRQGQVERGRTVPLKQYEDNLVLARFGEVGLVTLEFENGADKEYALLYVYPEPGAGDGVGYRALRVSDNVKPYTREPDIKDNEGRTIRRGKDVTEGWAITKEPGSQYIIMQRRGNTTTGLRPYTLTFAGVNDAGL